MPFIRKRNFFFILGALLVLPFTLFSRILHSPFLSDDWCLILPISSSSFLGTWQYGGAFYRPLALLTFLLQQRIWGMEPFAFRVFNIALHSLNVLLVFRFALRLLHEFFPGNSSWSTALLSAVLFLFLPSHSEPVAWIAGRPDLLATSLCLLSLYFYIPQMNSKTVLRVPFAASLLFFLFAMFSKESAFCLPLLAIALLVARSVMNQKAPTRPAIAMCGLFLLLLLLDLVFRKVMLGSILAGYGQSVHLNFSPAVIAKSVISFVIRSFLPPLPVRLGVMLRPFLNYAVVSAGIAGTLLALSGLRNAARVRFRTSPWSFACLLLLALLITILPVCNLGISLFSSDQERLVYFPSVFSCIFLAHILVNLLQRKAARFFSMIAMITLYAITLLLSVENHRIAGDLFVKIDKSIGKIGQMPALILNAPDNFRGVYLCRAYFGCIKAQHPNLEVLSLHSYHSTNSAVQIHWYSNREFGLALTDPSDEFRSVNPVAGCLEIVNRSNNYLRVRLDCNPASAVLLFSQGQMIDVSRFFPR